MIAEDDIIARHLAPIAGPGGLGLLDDAAMLTPPAGHDLVLTKDALVAGVHFFADDPPASIARKALRVNLSDLAAKGAAPAGFLLALALPQGCDEAWIEAFCAGLGEDALSYGCPLLGGDTVKASGGLTLSITALGYCPTGRMVLRTAGRAGDALAVTGTIGDAALGLKMRLEPDAAWVRALSDAARAHLADRYLHPQPRNAMADLIGRHARAGMDVSDGLLGDAVKLAASARLGLAPMIHLAEVPLSPAAREALALDPSLIAAIATGGDDYEVLMALPEAALAGLQVEAEALGCTVARIGSLAAADKPAFIGIDGRPTAFGALKFEHDWRG